MQKNVHENGKEMGLFNVNICNNIDISNQITKNIKKYLQNKNYVVLNVSLFRCGYSSGVERNLAKVDVVGPNPIARSN